MGREAAKKCEHGRRVLCTVCGSHCVCALHTTDKESNAHSL